MRINWKLLGILGILLSVGATEANAQWGRGPNGRWGKHRRWGYGVYASPVVVTPYPVGVTETRVLYSTPSVITREIIQPAPVVERRVVQPPPVVETRVVQPPPIVERRVVQPPPVVERRVVQPPPVIERRVIRSPAVEVDRVVAPLPY